MVTHYGSHTVTLTYFYVSHRMGVILFMLLGRDNPFRLCALKHTNSAPVKRPSNGILSEKKETETLARTRTDARSKGPC